MNIETMVVHSGRKMGDLHYLGPVKPTGDFLRQAVVCDGEWVAILAWGPACYALRDRDDELASPATLCRMENEVQRDAVEAINALFVEQFISSYSLAPKEIILDFDAMDGRFIGDTVGVLTLADHFRRFFIGSGHVKVGPALNADRC